MGIEFRLEHIGSTDLATTTHLGANLSQVSFLFVFREEPGFFCRGGKGRMENTKAMSTQSPTMTKKENDSNLVIEALVGTEHHSDTRQAFFHSSLVSLLIARLDVLETVRALDCALKTGFFVIGHVFAEHRSFAIWTIRNFKLTLL
jgi:hypothetical protein